MGYHGGINQNFFKQRYIIDWLEILMGQFLDWVIFEQ